MSDMMLSALELARQGWKVFPVHAQSKRPRLKSPGNGKGGFHQATDDSNQIVEWWSKYPTDNIGLQLPRGVIVIDIDGKEGLDTWRKLVRDNYPAFPDTRWVRGGREEGSWHIYLRVDPNLDVLASKLWASPEHEERIHNIDVKPFGKGYVLAPPSIHPVTGREYEWGNDSEIASAPLWLIKLLPIKYSAPRSPAADPPKDPEVVNKRIRGILEAVRSAQEGERNSFTFWGACVLRELGLAESEAFGLLDQYSPLEDSREIERTVRSAFSRS